MIRYRLDDLGWYQFEWLVQALLKDHLGIGVESWGGHGDHGRDAWCPNPLHFPAKQSKSEGPFLFQVKFIENANAAGAKPLARLIAAAKAEMAKFAVSSVEFTARGGGCKAYVLITNSLISPAGRSTIEAEVNKVLPRTATHFLSGSDICDLLDGSPAVKRAFPQLLSLRDLDDLLSTVVNREIIERSSSAISHARTVVPVFVPTAAYAQAWDVLKKHHFVVLEGPPEAGKSAIAWMIALTQISNEWEAIVCDAPEDFFRSFRADGLQIFIADDAFGRTEYDPARGAKWEAQLHRVFSRLSSGHWLAWTSRRHILERARKRMDLQGIAANFPKPAEVVVDAGQLAVEDKTLILYRHSKYSVHDNAARILIKSHAKQIVSDSAFTPERIRRFIEEALPHIAVNSTQTVERAALVKLIAEEIQNPTDRMRKSFTALQLSHKWMLLALLESGHYSTTEDLLSRYLREYGESEVRPRDILEELTEAFVRIKGTTQRYVEWIHPSYRDLVIEQLRDGGSLKSEFLNRMHIAGIKLALSDAGGAKGKLRFPLISSQADWEIVHSRCLHVSQTCGTEEGSALLTAISEALDSSIGQERSVLQQTLKAICRVLRGRWDAEQVELDSSTIDAYAAATERTTPMEPMPRLEASWEASIQRLRAQLDDEDCDFLFETAALDEFLSLIKSIQNSEPRLLRRIDFPTSIAQDIEMLLSRVNREIYADRSYSDREGYDSEADASFSLAASLDSLLTLAPEFEDSIKISSAKLTSHANSCREKYGELEGEDRGDDSKSLAEYQPRKEEVFDIEAVFADL